MIKECATENQIQSDELACPDIEVDDTGRTDASNSIHAWLPDIISMVVVAGVVPASVTAIVASFFVKTATAVSVGIAIGLVVGLMFATIEYSQQD